VRRFWWIVGCILATGAQAVGRDELDVTYGVTLMLLIGALLVFGMAGNWEDTP